MVHIDCLKENAIQKLSQNENVKCPRCQGDVQMYELKSYLGDKDMEDIEKAQKMQIVKLNENFVSCQCGNIMELVPGEVVRGQKDDKGNPMTVEAARHMA